MGGKAIELKAESSYLLDAGKLGGEEARKAQRKGIKGIDRDLGIEAYPAASCKESSPIGILSIF